LRSHFIRAATVYGSKLAWFFALAGLSLGIATTLYLTRAFFLLAWAVLAEKNRVSAAHWVALLTAFVGSIVALRPAVEGSIFGVLAALAAAATSAASAIQLKDLAKAEVPQTTTFILTALMIPVTAPSAALNWVSPPASTVVYLVTAAGLSLLTQLLLVHAYANVRLVFIATSDFLYLFCSFAAGVIAFGEHVDIQSVLGGVLILAGSAVSFFALERDLRPVTIRRKMQ
jgi:drug/metabolite transporter (DMT)-like permease